ncbi:MAG: hypothetical protein Q9220_007457 [cf. Caloplaca sp. 1 TL-2023]
MVEAKVETYDRYGQGDRDVSFVNGDGEGRYDNQLNGDSLALGTSQDKSIAAVSDRPQHRPPEIEHVTFGYLPLSTLITRAVQETFNSLTEVINQLSELQVLPLDNSTDADKSQTNVQKKTRLLDLAQDQRARYIKILVLSQWSRQAEATSRVIDLKIWLDGQRRLYDDACNWMGELKRIMESQRMPNPDLATALDALSLGRAPNLPDLGYLPPHFLSPQRMLAVLQGINAQLSIRLRLCATIPPSFRHYSIANGRATFHVPNEFELDVSIADDDPSSQLYFIDFRLAYSPASAELPEGRVRADLEGRVNHLLCNQGLKGCYHFLHDFALSHKINLLRNQAYHMYQGIWSEHLQLEVVHRSLIIQYWVGRAGGKNWIEIGIRRRKVGWSSRLHQEEDVPCLGVRWFRAGKEMNEVPVIIDKEELSAEAILKQIISAHTNLLFARTTAQLKDSKLYAQKNLKLKHHCAPAGTGDSHVSFQLTRTLCCTIIQEAVSGRISFLPPSSLNHRAEREVNSLESPEKDLAPRIAQLRAIASCDEIEQAVLCYGWEIDSTVRPSQESLRHHFNGEALKASFFRRPSWDPRWLLAFTASLAGDFWWIIEFDANTSKKNQITPTGPSIQAAFRIPLSDITSIPRELSFLDLARIERIAAGLISQFVDSKQLSIENIAHRFVLTIPGGSKSELPTLYIHLPKQRAQKLLRPRDPTTVPWASQVLRLSFMGIDNTRLYARHLVVARPSSTALQFSLLESMKGDSITFKPTANAFAFRLSQPVGQSTVPAILDRLARLQSLMDCVTTLRTLQLKSHDLSLGHLGFTYAIEPQEFRAKISFTGDEPLRLSLSPGNPHLRIQDNLAQLLLIPNSFGNVVRFLGLTLPLMRALATIEARNVHERVTILPRSAEWYNIRYHRPLKRFDIRLRRRRDSFMWFVRETSLPGGGDEPNQRIEDELSRMVDGRGQGWIGCKPGMAATPTGVEHLLDQIDQLFHRVSRVEPSGNDESNDDKGHQRKAEDDLVVVLD